MSLRWSSVALAAVLLSLPAAARADEEKAAEAAKTAPETVEVVKGKFAVWVEASGVLDARGATEVSVEPDVYGGELEVVEAFPGGTVEKDQLLVRFSTETIDEQLENARRDLDGFKRGVEVLRENTTRSTAGSQLARQRAELEKLRAERALSRFQAEERAMRVKEAELRLKGAEDSLKDQEEEHAQLEKLYGAGDAVEETERIVLGRSARQLERMRIGLEFQRRRTAWYLEQDLVVDGQVLELEAAKERLELERLLATADLQLAQGRIELEKNEAELARRTKAFEKLRADRDRLVVKAPRAGLAVPGGCNRGRWQGVDETARSLEKGKKLRARAPIFTIVDRGAVGFRTAVPEAKVLDVKAGAATEVRPAADEKKTLKGRVARVGLTPGEGGFEVVVDLDDRDDRLMPGFTAKAKILVRETADAIVLPVAAVGTDGEKRVVHVVDAEGKASPREVKVGETSDGKVEVLEGLSAGEKVLAKAPKG